MNRLDSSVCATEIERWMSSGSEKGSKGSRSFPSTAITSFIQITYVHTFHRHCNSFNPNDFRFSWEADEESNSLVYNLIIASS